jgi:adenosylhomocysteine nucleosidase
VRILITFAIENEFAPWRDKRGFRPVSPDPTQIAAPEAYAAEIAGAQITVVLTGAGPRPAAAAISLALQPGPDTMDFCISSGLAGALKPGYRIGQVLTAREIRCGDIEQADPGALMQSSEALYSFAGECGATPVTRFHTAGRVIGKAIEKKHLGETADAVEMESFVILSEASRRGVPAIAVRAISDLADEDLPFDMTGVFTEEGRISMPLVLAQVAKHPQSISAVMKLGQSAKTAATELAAFLDRYVEKLAAAGTGLEGRAASRHQ